MKNYTKFAFAFFLAAFSMIASAQSVDLFRSAASGNSKDAHKALFVTENVNALNGSGKTALDLAVERGNKKVARMILKKGGKVTSQANALTLKEMLKGRALGFFIGGFLVTPLMWIGTYFAIDDQSLIEVL